MAEGDKARLDSQRLAVAAVSDTGSTGFVADPKSKSCASTTLPNVQSSPTPQPGTEYRVRVALNASDSTIAP